MKISKRDRARGVCAIHACDFTQIYWTQYSLPVPARLLHNRLTHSLKKAQVSILSLSLIEPCATKLVTFLTPSGAQYLIPRYVWDKWTEGERQSLVDRMENTNSFTGKPKKRTSGRAHWSDTSNPNEAEIPEYVKPVRIGEL
jgi:hypothetical protein